ncbi:MAG: hypothetical protein II161_04805, partial [Erysipelotrichaceae bacterium]|nr:hypothetical protein [Erysipelotrichaceae bacterium]
IRLRPNPTRDRLTVERPDAGPATLEVFNAKGQKVLVRYPHGKVYAVELGIPFTSRNMILPCGSAGRFEP